MIARNIRHLRLFTAAAELKSLTGASERWHISQPAVTQAIGKLEESIGGLLFDRSSRGLFLTPRGTMLQRRVERAFSILDPSLTDIASRLKTTVSYSQLQALIAVAESKNFTLAARRMGRTQPTVHRAVALIERDAACHLFDRTSFGILATRPCQALVRAARLALCELDQADAELAAINGDEAGCVVIGAMPLSSSTLLPHALKGFRSQQPSYPVRIVDGPYDQLLDGLRCGEIDFLIGALRIPAPIDDIIQDRLFNDRLALLAGPAHPLAGVDNVSIDDLLRYPWIVPSLGTPARDQFVSLFIEAGRQPPTQLIESGSLLLMRELLNESQHLGCLSRLQSERECDRRLLALIQYPTGHLLRPIGLTYRRNWVPTHAQRLMLGFVADAVQPAN